MKAYFAFPSPPEELYQNPTPETILWTAGFALFFGLVLAFCWYQDR